MITLPIGLNQTSQQPRTETSNSSNEPAEERQNVEATSSSKASEGTGNPGGVSSNSGNGAGSAKPVDPVEASQRSSETRKSDAFVETAVVSNIRSEPKLASDDALDAARAVAEYFRQQAIIQSYVDRVGSVAEAREETAKSSEANLPTADVSVTPGGTSRVDILA